MNLTSEPFSSDAIAVSNDGDDVVHAVMVYDDQHSTPKPRDERLAEGILGAFACCFNDQLVPHSGLVVELMVQMHGNLGRVLERVNVDRETMIGNLVDIQEELNQPEPSEYDLAKLELVDRKDRLHP